MYNAIKIIDALIMEHNASKLLYEDALNKSLSNNAANNGMAYKRKL